MIQTRIRFDDKHGSFYVGRKCAFLFIPYWAICRKKGYYTSDPSEIRYFNTYDDARHFAIKMSIDMVVTHKRGEYEPMV